MSRTGMKAAFFGLWLAAALAVPTLAADRETVEMGEATLSVAPDWTLTEQRRDVETVYEGPNGESLRVFWWFPDEPLFGYDGEISHETRLFPAGPALVVRSKTGDLSAVKVAFERESADRERLLFLIESNTVLPEALEATLEPFLQELRFPGDPEPDLRAAAPLASGLVAGDIWHHDAAGNLSLRLPDGWRVFGADQPDIRRVSILSPSGDALLVVVVSDKTDAMDAYEARFYRDQVIPRQIDGESHDPVAGIAGHAVSISARIYGVADISLPYTRGQAWVFRGVAGNTSVMLAFVHANDAPQDQRSMLRMMANSVVIGLPPAADDGAAAPWNAAPAEVASPVTPPDPLAPDSAAALSFDGVLAALGPTYGGDCGRVDPATMPLTTVLSALSLSPEAAALCAGQGAAILAVPLPQDPRMGQGGMLGMVYLRGFLAQGKKPLVLVDTAHSALITVTSADAGISVAVSDLADLGASSAGPPSTAGAPPAPLTLFAGAPSADWLPHAVRGGKFDDWARFGTGGLSVDVPSQRDFGTTGLKSAKPVITLPAPQDVKSVRLHFDFDTATTTNAVFGLVPAGQLGKLDWDVHEIWVAIEQRQQEPLKLVLSVQRKVQARFTIADRRDLVGLTLELRPDGMIYLTNAENKVLVEGRMSSHPLATDLHLQVSATSPGHALPARLDLRAVTLDTADFVANDPAVLLADTGQTITLFDGRSFGPHFEVHAPGGLDLTGKLTLADGLSVASPEADGLSALGIYSPEPVVWLDRFQSDASVRLRFELDAAKTSGFRLALASPYSKAHGDPGFPRFVLDWQRLPDGTTKASRFIDREVDRLDATPAAMPDVVELVLTTDGVRVLAQGFPDDIQPWDALREGQGFRLYALTKADNRADPVALHLDRIILTRTPATDTALPPQPMPGVEPLPVRRHFPDPNAPWEPFGLAGVNFDESARFDGSGGVVVDVAAKYEGGRAGILSPTPVATLDERIDKTPYRLVLSFDPLRTDGAEVFLSNQKSADMAKGSEVALSLVRQSEGRAFGSYVLTLTKDYYAYWIRTISADDMARWDGTMMLDLSPGVLTMTLPGVISHRGSGFVGIGKGAAFHMVVQSLSDLKYGPARMALRQVTGEWLMPAMMTARDRMLLTEGSDFDAEAFLDLLSDRLSEDLQ